MKIAKLNVFSFCTTTMIFAVSTVSLAGWGDGTPMGSVISSPDQNIEDCFFNKKFPLIIQPCGTTHSQAPNVDPTATTPTTTPKSNQK